MKTTFLNCFFVLGILLSACKQGNSAIKADSIANEDTVVIATDDILTSDVLTKDQ